MKPLWERISSRKGFPKPREWKKWCGEERYEYCCLWLASADIHDVLDLLPPQISEYLLRRVDPANVGKSNGQVVHECNNAPISRKNLQRFLHFVSTDDFTRQIEHKMREVVREQFLADRQVPVTEDDVIGFFTKLMKDGTIINYSNMEEVPVDNTVLRLRAAQELGKFFGLTTKSQLELGGDAKIVIQKPDVGDTPSMMDIHDEG